ncbi:MAG: hypothetical protein KAU41_09580 [Deltaproteobacteria bacterium]|nr:hypothetical protein [Deltaproteobacteria bacterium]
MTASVRFEEAMEDNGKKPLTLDFIEQSLQDDLQSADPKIRQGATRLLLALLKQKQQREPSDDQPMLDPGVQKALAAHTAYLLGDDEVENFEN